MANKEMKDWMDNFEKLSGQKIINKDELNVLDDGTVETYQELKSDRDRFIISTFNNHLRLEI